ncbi:MAG: hypothetical protein EOO61_19095 [Hymenobacter sp.]|nr:MAG: hypothetical protein EOO61_19095 [Hymenobacter sp.]
MLLPLFGFVFGVASSASLGAVVLALHPSWKLTLRNICFFIVGSFTAVIGSIFLYTGLFADENQSLNSGALVFGFLATLCIATRICRRCVIN